MCRAPVGAGPNRRETSAGREKFERPRILMMAAMLADALHPA
jgi:hypothetical protein